MTSDGRLKLIARVCLFLAFFLLKIVAQCLLRTDILIDVGQGSIEHSARTEKNTLGIKASVMNGQC